jgi:hypothetical protein
MWSTRRCNSRSRAVIYTILRQRQQQKQFSSTILLSTSKPALSQTNLPLSLTWGQQQFRSFHFATPDYASCFAYLPVVDTQTLRNNALEYLKHFDPQHWHQDPVRALAVCVTIAVVASCFRTTMYCVKRITAYNSYHCISARWICAVAMYDFYFLFFLLHELLEWFILSVVVELTTHS